MKIKVGDEFRYRIGETIYDGVCKVISISPYPEDPYPIEFVYPNGEESAISQREVFALWPA